MMTFSNKSECDQERFTFFLALTGRHLMKLTEAPAWEEVGEKIICDLDCLGKLPSNEIQLGTV